MIIYKRRKKQLFVENSTSCIWHLNFKIKIWHFIWLTFWMNVFNWKLCTIISLLKNKNYIISNSKYMKLCPNIIYNYKLKKKTHISIKSNCLFLSPICLWKRFIIECVIYASISMFWWNYSFLKIHTSFPLCVPFSSYILRFSSL